MFKAFWFHKLFCFCCTIWCLLLGHTLFIIWVWSFVIQFIWYIFLYGQFWLLFGSFLSISGCFVHFVLSNIVFILSDCYFTFSKTAVVLFSIWHDFWSYDVLILFVVFERFSSSSVMHKSFALICLCSAVKRSLRLPTLLSKFVDRLFTAERIDWVDCFRL